jgi:hypothetical protein
LQQAIVEAGFDVEDLRRSRFGQLVLTKQVLDGDATEPSGLALQYAAVTTRALVILCLKLARHTSRQHAKFKMETQNVELVLERLIQRAAEGSGFHVCDEDNAVVFEVNADGTVGMDSLRGHRYQAVRTAASRLEGDVDEDDNASLVDLLNDLWHQKSLAARFADSGSAKLVVNITACAIHTQFEVSIGEAWWLDATLLNLKPMVLAGGQKPRQSRAYKQAIYTACRDAKESHGAAAHFMDAHLLTEGVDPKALPNQSKVVYWDKHDEALAYFVKGPA